MDSKLIVTHYYFEKPWYTIYKTVFLTGWNEGINKNGHQAKKNVDVAMKIKQQQQQQTLDFTLV